MEEQCDLIDGLTVPPATLESRLKGVGRGIGGWGDGKQCLLPFLAAPLSASLNSPSCSCRALQQVTCINDASRLGSGERPMWVPMRARDPVP